MDITANAIIIFVLLDINIQSIFYHKMCTEYDVFAYWTVLTDGSQKL